MSAAPSLASEALPSLQAQLSAVVTGGRKASAPLATGIMALDAALGGGIPRGRITELTGPLAVGKTALLRQVVSRVLQTGAWVAWIDAGRTLAAAPWSTVGQRFVVVRPPDPRRSAWTADLLLRSGVFGLVVIDGAPSLSRVHGVRLAQLARERDAACVVLEHVQPGEARPSRLAGTLRLKVSLAPPSVMHAAPRWSRKTREARDNHSPPPAKDNKKEEIRITVEKGGTGNNSKLIEVNRVVVVARRVCAHSEIPDRRGVARSARRPWTARGNSTDNPSDAQHHEHPVTWGGLGVAAHDLYGVDLPGHPARLAAGFTDDIGDRLPDRTEQRRDPRSGDRLTPDRSGQRPLSSRELARDDQRTRDWTTYRGRRRAAESQYGRRSRRELARERTGATLVAHSGQSRGSNGSPRLGRDDAIAPG
jgi:hypothetical protein